VAVAIAPEAITDQAVDPVTGWLDDVLAGLADGVAACAMPSIAAEVPDDVRIDRIAQLEKVKAAAGALQAAESVRFAQSQAKAQLAADVHPDKIGRGIADQLGLACHMSGFAAARRLGVARALWFELPETYQLLIAGEISGYIASLVVTRDAPSGRSDETRRGRQDRCGRDRADGAAKRRGVCSPRCVRGGSAWLCAARPD